MSSYFCMLSILFYYENINREFFSPIDIIFACLKSIKGIISKHEDVSRLEDATGVYLNFVRLNSL